MNKLNSMVAPSVIIGVEIISVLCVIYMSTQPYGGELGAVPLFLWTLIWTYVTIFYVVKKLSHKNSVAILILVLITLIPIIGIFAWPLIRGFE